MVRLFFRLHHLNSIIRKQRKLDKIIKIKEWTIKKGDKVELLAGKQMGQQGIIHQIIPHRNSVIIEGFNMTKRYVRRTQDKAGAIILKEGLIHVSNVNLVDPETGYRTRVKVSTQEDGQKVRVSTRNGNIIPWPEETKLPIPKINEKTDTPSSVATEHTYIPPNFEAIGKGELAPHPETGKSGNNRPNLYTQAQMDFSHIVDFKLVNHRN